MKPLYRFSLLSLFAILVLASCKQKVPVQVNYIPKQADVVASFNSGVLKSKLIQAKFTPTEIWNYMRQNGNEDSAIQQAKAVWNDVKQSGIDMDGGLFAYSYNKGNIADGQSASVNGLVVALKSPEALEQTIQTKGKNKTINQAKNFKYIYADSNQVLAWNKSVAMLVSYSTIDTTGFRFDSATQQIITTPKDTLPSDSLQVVAEVTAYFDLDESNSLADYDTYRELVNKETDGTIWYNIAKKIAPVTMLSAKADALFSNLFFTATFNFDDGAIAFETNIHTNDRLAAVLKKYSGPGIDSTTLKAYPSNDIHLINAFKFNPAIIEGLIKETDLEELVNTTIQKVDSTLTLKDFSNALGGDINVFVSDFQLPVINLKSIRKNKDSLNKLLPSVNFLMQASVNDSVALTKLFTKWIKGGNNSADSAKPTSKSVANFLGFNWTFDKNQMLLHNNSTVAAQYAAGGNNTALTSDVLQQAQGKAGFFYFDIADLLGKPQISDTLQNSGLAKARLVFKDAIGSMHNVEGNTIKGRFEIRLKQDKTNSLVTLIQMLTGFVQFTSVDAGVIKVNEAQLLDIPSRLGMM